MARPNGALEVWLADVGLVSGTLRTPKRFSDDSDACRDRLDVAPVLGGGYEGGGLPFLSVSRESEDMDAGLLA